MSQRARTPHLVAVPVPLPRVRSRTPVAVDRAAKALVLLALWLVAGVILTLLSLDARRAAAHEKQTSLTPAEIDQAVDLAVRLGVGLAVVAAIVSIIAARNLRLAKGWARALATVITAVVGVLSLVGFGADGAGTAGTIQRVGAVVLSGLVLAWLWSAPASRFFRV